MPPTATNLPERFGRYRILRILGEGGMGTVYLAEDGFLGRRVAIKVPKISEEHGNEFKERFLREARVAAGIAHPNICPVFDAGDIDGILYLTMPFIVGTPLKDLLDADEPWEPARAAGVIIRLAKALHTMHEQGYFHRDLKPANIMLCSADDPVLMDFGLARAIAPSHWMTQSGAPLGTPAYMSPEQVRANPRDIGKATDIYSLGVVLYRLLAGELPFQGRLHEIYGQILYGDLTPPSALRTGLDRRWDGLCLKAMAKVPTDRYETMDEFASALQAHMDADHAMPGRRPRIAGARQLVPNSIGMNFALIPAGRFLMGSPPTEPGRSKDEGPQHEVEIMRPFYLGVSQVTQEEYERVMGRNPSWFVGDKVGGLDTKRFPVEQVTWEEAQEFCRKLAERPEEKRAGHRYRLPTEAEWEYACRGGASSTVFPFGDSLSSTQANFDGNNPYGRASKGPYLERTTTVGSYEPNGFGLYDVIGNVWEWCEDVWHENYEEAPTDGSAWLTGGDRRRVVRGGSWVNDAIRCRPAGRLWFGAGFRGDFLGFRVVRVFP